MVSRTYEVTVEVQITDDFGMDERSAARIALNAVAAHWVEDWEHRHLFDMYEPTVAVQLVGRGHVNHVFASMDEIR